MVTRMDGGRWCLANGIKRKDERREFTYVGARGASVIDYLLVNIEE